MATGYMCKVDYDYHLELDWNGVSVYPTLQSLKKHRKCVKECGYIKVEVKEVEI